MSEVNDTDTVNELIIRTIDPTIALAENAMLRHRPDLFDEWDFEKNDELGLDIYKMTNGMDRKVNWICKDCGSDYISAICYRSIRSHGCHYCSGMKVNHTNSLESLRPDLLKEWNFNKNIDVTPDKVTIGNSLKVWWKCNKCKSEYDMRINHKATGINCPYCRGYRVNETNSLKSLNPLLANEWHPVKNSLSSSDVTVSSNKKVWWLGECGHEWESSLVNRKKGNGCPICSGKKIFIGFNDMWTTNPELAKLLANPEDGYKYTFMSNKRVDWKCNVCQEVINNKQISSISVKGLSCSSCSDGVSYPEKFLFNTLKQTNIKIHPQKRFDWSDGKVYDFYLPDLNTIIEVHGLQHYERRLNRGGRNLKEEQENDKLKFALAKNNSIENYIVIDARISDKGYIIKSICLSELSKILPLKSIDWIKVQEDSIASIIKKAYELWNSEINSLEEIVELLGVSVGTLRRYLRGGNKNGFCKFPRISKAHSVRESVRRSVVQLDLDGNYVNEYDAVVDASRAIGSKASLISACCKGKAKTAYGFKWVYKEDYYKEVNNIVND